MVDFAGWELPVVYAGLGLGDSVRHTRQAASLFDVSHMLQTHIRGRDRIAFMESLVPADLKALSESSGSLTIFTNPNGGIEDDLIVTKAGDYLYVVSNAGCAEADLAYMETTAGEWRGRGKDVTVEAQSGRGLVALQGPKAVEVLSPLLELEGGESLESLWFMRSATGRVAGVEGCRVSRCGYTGEDGVEISVPAEGAVAMAEALLGSADTAAAGLGARDALRLEAGLCLYGNDIDGGTTPAEAGLAWLVSKRRREEGGFPGAEVIVSQLKEKSWRRRRVGLSSSGGRPVRRGAKLRSESGELVGEVTSGVPSPTLSINIAMAYLPTALAKNGTKLLVDHSGKDKKLQEVTVTKMPFLPTHYYMPPKK